jgi:hypothetical protein
VRATRLSLRRSLSSSARTGAERYHDLLSSQAGSVRQARPRCHGEARMKPLGDALLGASSRLHGERCVPRYHPHRLSNCGPISAAKTWRSLLSQLRGPTPTPRAPAALPALRSRSAPLPAALRCAVRLSAPRCAPVPACTLPSAANGRTAQPSPAHSAAQPTAQPAAQRTAAQPTDTRSQQPSPQRTAAQPSPAHGHTLTAAAHSAADRGSVQVRHAQARGSSCTPSDLRL